MRSTWGESEYRPGWGFSLPPVLKWLLIANFGIFLLQTILRVSGIWWFENMFHLSTRDVPRGFLWQFVTYMFLHSGVFHIFWNLVILFFFAPETESGLGSRRFLHMYLLAGIFGGLLWYLVCRLFLPVHLEITVTGASASTYAVIIAFATLYPDRPITLFPLPITLLAKHLAWLTVLISVLLQVRGEGDAVAHLAHLGGMAVGFLYVKAVRSSYSLPRFQMPRFRMSKSPEGPKLRVLPPASQKDEFIQQRIDPILDKIAEKGIQSLTVEERRILDEAKDHLS